MKELGNRIKLMPLHAVVMCLCAIMSFVAVFVPMFKLYIANKMFGNYSLLTLVLHPRVYTHLNSVGSVNLDFQGIGIQMFVVSLVLAVAALTLTLSYQLFVDNKRKRRFGCIAVLVLFALRAVLHMYTASNLISDYMIQSNNLTEKKLFFTQSLMGNMLVVVLVIGIVASLYGALGIKMNYKLFSYPYIAWVVLFTVLPLVLIFFRAFFKQVNGGYEFTTAGFEVLFDPTKTVSTTFYGHRFEMQEFFSVFLRSLDYAVWTTIGCLIIAYPLAYTLATRAKRLHKSGSRLLMLFVLPMWMNTMLRTYAWRAFFSETGVLNTFLMKIGVIDAAVEFLKNDVLSDIITKLVMTNDFLPFMILPIYSVIIKIDGSLYEASYDLGANRVQTFLKVIFPLSLPGVISGIQMVFMPSLTFYMIPDIITEGSKTTIGNTVQSFILNESAKYNQAGNVLSLLLLIFVLITMGVLRNQDKEAGSGGMML